MEIGSSVVRRERNVVSYDHSGAIVLDWREEGMIDKWSGAGRG